MAEELYMEPDRGEFLVRRLVTQDGIFTDVNCRIKKASVFNFGSQYAYALVGYQIEFWGKDEPAPYKGGTAKLFRPKDRPDFTTLYVRTKVSNTNNMLYLEDAIINDFINVKVLQQSIYLESYDEASEHQRSNTAVARQLIDANIEYRNALHTTRYESSATQPLVVKEQWMSYQAIKIGAAPSDQTYYIRNMPFVSLRDMIEKLVADFNK